MYDIKQSCVCVNLCVTGCWKLSFCVVLAELCLQLEGSSRGAVGFSIRKFKIIRVAV